MENHHCRLTFDLLEDSGLLDPLPPDAVRGLRATMIEAILATDISRHSALLEQLRARAETGIKAGAGGDAGRALPPQEERTLLVAAALHAADLHSPLMEPELDRGLAALVRATQTAPAPAGCVQRLCMVRLFT